MIALRSVEAFCYRYPLATPVVTSFGRMGDRPAVLIRVEDADGVVGWGEAWCNFPPVGAEHRTRIVREILAPLMTGSTFAHPSEAFAAMTRATAVMALQSGEPGPFAQAIAGIDIALWDLHARRLGEPLWRLLGGASPTIGVYASGINPTDAAITAARAHAAGHRAFKLKIGFDPAQDDANIAAIRAAVGDLPLAVDANQGWGRDEACRRAAQIARFDLAWLEEPLRADSPREDWRAVAAAGGPTLAAGENVAGAAAFEALLREGVVGVVQPDMAKWGGFTGCVPVGRAIREAGRRFFPHYLGGGIGLLASAHLLAGIGGDGLLEVDCNDNPLRDLLCGPAGRIVDGTVTLSEAPGLGFTPDLAALAAWRRM
ncbi:mandelate racemase/muconate lactonizing enzyme family protein [Xanthobacter sediminis]